MYDKDGSGSIELPEMIEIIGTLYEMEGVPKVRISFGLLSLFFGWRGQTDLSEICHLPVHFLL